MQVVFPGWFLHYSSQLRATRAAITAGKGWGATAGGATKLLCASMGRTRTAGHYIYLRRPSFPPPLLSSWNGIVSSFSLQPAAGGKGESNVT